MTSHLVISNGHLYDTRVEDWVSRPLRSNFKTHNGEIATVSDMKAALRAGGVHWFGLSEQAEDGRPANGEVLFQTADGRLIPFDEALAEFPRIVRAIRHDDVASGWRVTGCGVREA